MSDEPKNRSPTWVWITLAALLVLYPLSVGPACYIVMEADSPAAWTFTSVAYAPLRWLSKSSTTAKGIITRYERWWAPERLSPINPDR